MKKCTPGLLLALLLFWYMPASAQCLNSWIYEVPITVSNANSYTLTNFQVKITLNTQALITAGKMQATGADIRFTDGSCNNLPYWIENQTINTTQTAIWVKASSLPIGNSTLHLYYGNNTATAAQSGSNTFEMFDDFDNLNNWTQCFANSWNTTTAAPPGAGTGSFATTGSNSSATNAYNPIYNPNYNLVNGIVETRFYATEQNNTWNSIGTGLMLRTGNCSGGGYFMNAGGYIQAYEIAEINPLTNNNWTTLNGTGNSSSLLYNNWYRFQSILNNTALTMNVVEGLLAPTTLLTTNTTYTSGFVGFKSWQKPYVDWIFVRKFALQQPTVTNGTAQPRLLTGTLASGTFCAGASIAIPYTVVLAANAGNTFTAQLSDASGSFANPVAIGSVAATTSGSIAAVIPTATVGGNGYRIRVVASNASYLSYNNGTDITINANPVVNAISNQAVCNGASFADVIFTGTVANTIYSWSNNNTGIGLPVSGTGNIAGFAAVNTTNAPIVATVTVTPSTGNGPIAQTFGNTNSITIPESGSYIAANPYPSNITVSGLSGPLSHVAVKLNGYRHTFPDDVDMLLVGPGGQQAIIMSDVGGTSSNPGVNLIIDDNAATILPDNGPLVSGTFRPNNIGTGDQFNAPAPAPNFNTLLSAFNNTDPNGTWSLYIMDDAISDGGSLTGGWELVLTTEASSCTGTSQSFTYTINPTPTIVPVDNQTVCLGSTTNEVVFDGAVSGTVYNWTNNNTAIGLAASGTGNIASFTPLNATNDVVTATITVTPAYTANGITCYGTPGEFTISVNPIPTVNVVDNKAACAGTNSGVFMLSGAVAGTTFNWTNSNTAIGLGASGSGMIPFFVATNNTNSAISGTVTVTPTFTSGGTTCTGTSTSFVITANPRPAATITGGGVTVCQDDSVQLTGVSNPNHSYSWGKTYFEAPYTEIGTAGSQSISSSGIYQLKVTDVSTTCFNTASTIVNVADYVFNGSIGAGDAQQTGRINRYAVLSTCAGPKSCPGLYTDGNLRRYDSYTITNPRNEPVCAVIGISSNCGTGIFSVAYSGSFNPAAPCNNYLADPGSSFLTGGFYEATIPANGTIVVVVHEVNAGAGCSNYSLTVALPRAAAGITAAPITAVCSGTPVVLTASAANTYSWTPGNQSANAITVTSSGMNSVLLGYGNTGCTVTASKEINFVPTPGVNTVANQVLCAADNTTAIVFDGNVAGAEYNWTNSNPNIGLAASGTGDIASFVATNTGTTPLTATVTVTPSYTNGGVSCDGMAKTFTITVNPLPVLVTHDTTIQSNGTVNLTAPGFTAGSDANLTLSYWTNANATIPVATPASVGNGTYYIVAQNSNGCKDTGATTVTIIPLRTISGRVHNDVDGLNGSPANTINGPGTNAGNLKAVLIRNGADTIVKVQTVASDGTFLIEEVFDGNYQLLITTATIAGTGMPAVNLATGWVHTAEFLGAGPGSDGNRNGILNLNTVNSNLSNARFGIEQPPVAANSTVAVQLNPGSNASVQLSGSAYNCSDPSPGAVRQIRFTSFPANAASAFIGFNSYTAANWPTQGVTVSAIGNQPLLPVSIDPLSGPVIVSIPYVAIDAAGFTSDTAKITMPFSGLDLGGIVHNNVSGLNGVPVNTINGQGITFSGLYAILIDAISNMVIDTVRVSTTDGSFAFPDKDIGYYSVMITTTQTAIGAAVPAVTLPQGWIATGEKNGSSPGTDGFADGKLYLGLQNTNNSQLHLGLQQPPTATAATAAAQLNPGSNNTATVPATTFVTNDPQPGAVTALYFSGALPANANRLVLNGITYSATNPLPPAGVRVTVSNGAPTSAILVDPVNGNTVAGISYRAVDASGMMSAPAIASVPFVLQLTNNSNSMNSNGVGGLEQAGNEGDAVSRIRYEVSVYPNPTSDRIFVKTNYAENIEEIQLLDIQGRTLHRQRNNFSAGIEMAQRAAGTYLVKVIFLNGLIRDFKVVKN